MHTNRNEVHTYREYHSIPNKNKKVKNKVRLNLTDDKGDTIVRYNLKIHWNMFSIFAATAVGMCAPLPLDWKIGIIAMIFFTSINVELEEE